MDNTEIAAAAFAAYRAQDRPAAERLMADALVFTSPQDDHIDRAAWFETCFPTAERFVRQDVLSLVDDGDDGVFALYEYELATGEVHRNIEHLTVRDGRIVEVHVFFGGRY